MKKYLFVSAFTALFLGCSEEGENLKPDSTIEVVDEHFQDDYIDTDGTPYSRVSSMPAANAEVKVFTNELSFWNGDEPIANGITEANGEAILKWTKDCSDCFYYAEKGSENSLRFNFIYPGKLGLSTTPTKLQFNVINNGEPVEGASVLLYFSERSYINDIPAYNDYDELKKSYVDVTDMLENGIEGWGYDTKYKSTFEKLSDTQGEVFFDDLEPRKYWFRIITEDGLSNDGGTISLDQPLPDDPNITTSITVGVN